MSDLIDRQKAIRNICNEDCHKPTPCKWKCIAIEELEALPSAQPERKKGKWLKAGTRMGIPLFECSLCECGEEVPTVMGKPSYNFCPNCGADMREGDAE